MNNDLTSSLRLRMNLIQAVEDENPELYGDLANEVWKLYEKYQPYLATRVIEFGNELKDLLGKYQNSYQDNYKNAKEERPQGEWIPD